MVRTLLGNWFYLVAVALALFAVSGALKPATAGGEEPTASQQVTKGDSDKSLFSTFNAQPTGR